jgi:ribonuclease HI
MTLFPTDDVPPAAKKAGPALTLHFDGGSRGNPGPAGIGVTITDEKQNPVYELAEFLGTCTNNVAEYTALLRGLTAAVTLGATKLTVRSDSELLVRQINGIYKVKSPDLKPLYQQAVSLISKIGEVKVSHTYREGNTRADELANMAMDERGKIEPLGPASSK